jgi:hypothetical protein
VRDLVEVRPSRDVTLDPPGRPTVIADATGTSLATLRGGRLATRVALDEVAPTVLEAVIAVEDVRSCEHTGVDARALTRNVRNAAVVEGGSTTTQQLAKNTVTGNARTIERNLVEASIALQLDQMSKDQILPALSQQRVLRRAYVSRRDSDLHRRDRGCGARLGTPAEAGTATTTGDSVTVRVFPSAQ